MNSSKIYLSNSQHFVQNHVVIKRKFTLKLCRKLEEMYFGEKKYGEEYKGAGRNNACVF